ncbi:DUF2306 domain-containing protein [Primorskyibacter sp. 2E233]|uniref:DUF2306 domain-containing protein n=1 Tax=Primorskyibacter sp. 2E233 TaxID=3413431 RepID=UPI003BF37BCF
MTLAPLLSAPVHIQIHAFAAMIALGLGPAVIYRRRRDTLHKVAGYIWVGAMVLTALSSFSIRSFALVGPFSPIHLLALLTLWSTWLGMRHAVAGRIRAHEQVMQGLYWRGLCVAALFNFLPGRVVNRIFFAQAAELGYVVIALGGIALVAQYWRGRRLSRRVARTAATIAGA